MSEKHPHKGAEPDFELVPTIGHKPRNKCGFTLVEVARVASRAHVTPPISINSNPRANMIAVRKHKQQISNVLNKICEPDN